MGDRGNVRVVDGDFSVYLYSHWGGSDLPFDVQKALAKEWRWTDPAYLTRIIFEVLIEGQEHTETGFGISNSICDNEHPIIVVDCDKQQVRLENEDGTPIPLTAISFKDFSAVSATRESLTTWFSREFERV